MHIHILGICGTFMGGLALLARELGHTVSGSDVNVYPPMSTQLEEQGITQEAITTASFNSLPFVNFQIPIGIVMTVAATLLTATTNKSTASVRFGLPRCGILPLPRLATCSSRQRTL